MKMLILTAIQLNLEASYLNSAGIAQSPSGARDLDFDDLEQPVMAADTVATNQAVAAAMANAPVGVYFPIAINAEDIREFYPRKGARSGTRIVLKNGAARPVKELFTEVQAAFEAA